MIKLFIAQQIAVKAKQIKHPEDVEVGYSKAKRCTFIRLVDCEGGNLNSGDKHFIYRNLEK